MLGIYYLIFQIIKQLKVCSDWSTDNSYVTCNKCYEMLVKEVIVNLCEECVMAKDVVLMVGCWQSSLMPVCNFLGS